LASQTERHGGEPEQDESAMQRRQQADLQQRTKAA